jgi:hypothetical protein
MIERGFKMERIDFSYQCNDRGYTIKYKGQNIGGAGIIGQNKGHWRNKRKDILMYKQHAISSIENLLNGNGESRFLKVIENINK